MHKKLFSAMLFVCTTAIIGGTSISASAQLAGSTTNVGIAAIELREVVAMGWSAKKSILGKTVYNENNERVGKVMDLIISPDRKVSYVIIGAGGFIGIGRNDVAIPASQLQDMGGKLVLPGATKEAVKAMPRFEYTNDGEKLIRYLDQADQDIAKGKAQLSALNDKAKVAAADAKVAIDAQSATLRSDLKIAEDKLVELKRAGKSKWKAFEADTNAAIARLRLSIDRALG